MGGAAILLLLRGGSTPIVVPATMLAAIRAFWQQNGLDATVCKLWAYGAPPSLKATDYPFIVIDAIREMLPGETPTDLPVEMFATVHAVSGMSAAAKKKLMEDWLDSQIEPTPGASPVVNPNRLTPLTWATGGENFNERDETTPSLEPTIGAGNVRVFKARVHFTFWIYGRP